MDERGDVRGEFIRVVDQMVNCPPTTARFRKLYLRQQKIGRNLDPTWRKIFLRKTYKQAIRIVGELGKLDPKHKDSGSREHKYAFDPPLDDEEIDKIEERLACKMPESYRRFVTEFGDGGAGPVYGIIPLRRILDPEFQHGFLRTASVDFPTPANADESHELGWEPPGTIEIAEIGCGGFYHLVLSGSERGNIWIGDSEGFWSPVLINDAPKTTDGEGTYRAVVDSIIRASHEFRMDFWDWYSNWLDEAQWIASTKHSHTEELFDLDPDTSELFVPNRGIARLPESMRTITSLETLRIAGNQITEIPDWIGEFEQLECFSILENPVQTLPASIGNLKNLQQLYCKTKNLAHLPRSIGELSNLEKLTLSFNELKSLPDSIGQLRNLRRLDLSHNQLTQLPDSIGQLTSLKVLGLTWNQLFTLPESMAGLVSLEELSLRDNQFREIPDWIAALPNLRHLHLGENENLDVRDTILKLADMPSLERLSFFRVGLAELPPEIGLLTQLTSLDLSWNQLTTLPEEFGMLTNLKRINLDHNTDTAHVYELANELVPDAE